MDRLKACIGCLGFFSSSNSRTLPDTTHSHSVNSCRNLKPFRVIPLSVKTDEKKDHIHHAHCCGFSYSPRSQWWTQQESLPSYTAAIPTLSDPNDIAAIIEEALDSCNLSLRELSLKIHGHPEVMFQERYAHDLLSSYMAEAGFNVTRHYLGLSTAWKAEYVQGTGGRVIGINSEMDALPGIGHACGHNLIAISGVGIAMALKVALQARPGISGKVVLLGTPAEEGGGGKVIILERGGYNEMDVCIMSHPTSGLPHSTNIGSTTAMQSIQVEYFGHSAHAGNNPWEGTNALDAAFLAYSGVSVLRQQIKPDHRVHGVVDGKNWMPNVIPNYAKMRWIVRAPKSSELTPFVERVKNCLEAAALATSCRIEITMENPYFELNQNPVLGQSFVDIVENRYGLTVTTADVTASTDFGNVSYALPSLHPAYSIPTEPNGSNHTPEFANSAISEAAHSATILIAKGLALTAFRVLTDSDFFYKVQASFEQGCLVTV